MSNNPYPTFSDGNPNSSFGKYFATGGTFSLNDLTIGKSLFSGNICDMSIKSEEPKVKETKETKKILKPRQIKDYLDQYVIGQEDAKISLAVAVYNHYKRINSKIEDDGIELQKSNILMLGNSGSGKTLLAQTIAKLLEVPFIIVDATAFTPTGIVGKCVEDIAKDLIKIANGDKSKAEKGIVYIDEIDKIASNSSMTRKSHNVKGVLGGETQSAFLKLIEGNEIETESSGNSMFGSSNSTKLNTKNILFICGGAFAGIEDFIEREEVAKTIGFGVSNKKISEEEFDVWDKIGTEEIIKFGMMPEMVGRLPVLLKLKPLEKKDLINILTQPKNAIIKQYQKLMEIDGINLDFTNDALEMIADISIEKKIGARGLRGVIENIMTKVMFNIPDDDEYMRKCVITAEHIKNHIMPDFDLTVNEEDKKVVRIIKEKAIVEKYMPIVSTKDKQAEIYMGFDWGKSLSSSLTKVSSQLSSIKENLIDIDIMDMSIEQLNLKIKNIKQELKRAKPMQYQSLQKELKIHTDRLGKLRKEIRL